MTPTTSETQKPKEQPGFDLKKVLINLTSIKEEWEQMKTKCQQVSLNDTNTIEKIQLEWKLIEAKFKTEVLTLEIAAKNNSNTNNLEHVKIMEFILENELLIAAMNNWLTQFMELRTIESDLAKNSTSETLKIKQELATQKLKNEKLNIDSLSIDWNNMVTLLAKNN